MKKRQNPDKGTETASLLSDLSAFDWRAVDAMDDRALARQIKANPDAAPDMTKSLERGEFSASDVSTLRHRLGLSQQAFADLLLLRVSTIRNWEQSRRIPRGPATTLLTLMERDPETIRGLLSQRDGTPPHKSA
jgi:putative transcriptional regulator